MSLKYVGKGRFLPGVPARDLTDAEAKRYPKAAKSGLYERVAPPKKEAAPDAGEEK